MFCNIITSIIVNLKLLCLHCLSSKLNLTNYKQYITYKSTNLHEQIQQIIKPFNFRQQFYQILQEKINIDISTLFDQLKIQNIFRYNLLSKYIFLDQRGLFIYIQDIEDQIFDMPPKRTLEVTPYDLNYVPSEIQGQCIILAVLPIAYVQYKFFIFVFVCILTIGIPLLLVFWWPSLIRYFYYEFVPISQATHLFVQNYDNQVSIVPKQIQNIFDGQTKQEIAYFINRYLKYIIKGNTVTVLQYRQAKQLRHLMGRSSSGWATEDAQMLALSFGPGAMIIQRPTALAIFVGQIFRPLYIFLLFNVVVQLKLQYYYFCIIITASAVIGIIITILQVMKVNEKIFQMSYYQIPLNVLRSGKFIQMSSMDIVPGDLVFFNKAIRLPFQGVLLQGQLLINQCVLTGQSVPVAKKSLTPQHYASITQKIDKSSCLYEGTTIVQINSKKKMLIWQQYRNQYGVPVCVTKTNFATLKGQLIRKILYPNQLQNSFQRQSTKFLIFIFFVSMTSYLLLTIKLWGTIDLGTLISRGLDLISIAVPPTLPISMTIGIIYAIQKLKKKEIYTISPNQIIEGGLLNTMCFDKTGTLTHDHMDFKTLVPCYQRQFQATIDVYKYVKKNSMPEYVKQALSNMACNHTVVKIEYNNQLIGDPMQIKLLQFSGSTIQTDCQDPNILFTFSGQFQSGVAYRRFDFDSEVQRMSVICKMANGSYFIFTKGSPEIMLSIMKAESIPNNYKQKLKEYASSGFRILAIASRAIDNQSWKNMDRNSIQTDLSFNGFLIFQNGLKTETRAAIEQLRLVNINPIMITGDNPITASNIGYQSAILDPNTKTIIVDYSQGKITEDQFIYVCEGLEDVPFKRDQFRRRSNKSAGATENQNLQYVDELLQKIQINNYNVCLTGSAFNHIFAQFSLDTKQQPHPFLVELIQATQILARTKPTDKAKVVKLHQRLGAVVGMCGDGANDCAALNQANLGLSLSDTEASIAAAFTAKQRHVGSMVELIKQSRAGLATNYSLFNIMACYALIQYTSSLMQQYFYSYPAQNQFIYWDLFLNFIFVFLLGNIDTAPCLSKQRPSGSLLSIFNIVKLAFFYLLLVTGLITSILVVRGPFADEINYWQLGGEQNNLQRYTQKGKGDFLFDTIENNVIFVTSNFYYLSSIIVFTISAPWKKEIYSYLPFIVSFILVVIYTMMLVVIPAVRISSFNLNSLQNTQKLNLFLLELSLAIAMITIFLQRYVINPFFQELQQQEEQRKRHLAIQ